MRNVSSNARGMSAQNRARRRNRSVQTKGWQRRRRMGETIRCINEGTRKGHENIDFLFDFLANAKRDHLFVSGNEVLYRLQRLFMAYADNELFEKEFPAEDIDSYLDQQGRPLSYIHESKSRHFRYHTIRCCARKAYDMLTSSSSIEKLDELDEKEFKYYSDLYDVLRVAAGPVSTAHSLKELIEAKVDRKARVS